MEHRVAKSTYTYLTKSENADVFENVEKEASLLVVAYSGIDIPENVVDAPQWVQLPMALFIDFILSSNIQFSKEAQDVITTRYNEAKSICEKNRIAENAKNGTFYYGDMPEGYR